MKGMPLPFDFEGPGALDLELVVERRGVCGTLSFDFFKKNCFLDSSFVEPTSVLDSARISSRPTSSSTLSSSFCGGATSTDTAGVAAVSDTNPSPKWQQDSTTATSSNVGPVDSELLPVPTSLETGIGNAEKCAMEDWESVLSEPLTVSPTQEQSILRMIIGDAEDPGMGNLQYTGGGASSAAAEFEFNAGNSNRSNAGNAVLPSNAPSNYKFAPGSKNLVHPSSISDNFGAVGPHHQATFDSSAEMKPPIFSPQLLMNQHQIQQSQNPSFYLPLTFAQHQEQNPFVAPQAKRLNTGTICGGQISKGSYENTGQQDLLINRQQAIPHQLQLLPQYPQHRPMGSGQKPKIGGGEEPGHCLQQQQQAIIDQLYKAAELVQTGNPVLAQEILARLNHQFSPIDKPFHRAAFYCKEALQLLLQTNNNLDLCPATSSPFSLIFKIGAYKAFSEISPLVQFAHFTCNQALLEAFDGFHRIHIVDFDIGYGGQWASLIQELALRNEGTPSLKITVLASASTHDQIELGLTRENLVQFASEVNLAFEFEVMSIESLNSGSWSQCWHMSDGEVVAVNLPVGSLVNYQVSVPLVLHFVKQLSPRIVVSVDRGCDRTDLSFANHMIHALQSYSNLLESLDAVNMNADAMQKIERFLIHPGIEKVVMGRFRYPEKTQHWRTMFLSSGLSPVAFSNFTESQAECLLKKTPVRGFLIEKRQSSLVLCWQRKELISASAWRC
ncbi:scarecrow-like protein 22-like [Dorcoceras hygrometricum]|uniref:Scarecrow-like protein 22-like n=1 Tax=Dorcoceras hygrometricum TaxID=472368 RepID=A0A2Z7CJQ3_9LAMI|nr:scarecrow-like protein 22-like [Dorcoceras hygrometricum]